jgi:putative long chain acyl-CoA synthase
MGSGMPSGLWRRVEEVFNPAHVVEFFTTTDGQAVLANVSGAKVGSEGRPLPGGGQIALAAYDVDDDLILEGEDGFVARAQPNEVGVLLAHPRGPVDPTAAVKRGVFAPGDTWVSTEFLFRRDDDGDYWMVDSRRTLIRTPRGVVFGKEISNALGRLEAVDIAVTYRVDVEDRQVAVTALSLRPGAGVPAAELSEVLGELPVGVAPDVIYVADEMPLNASYRPVLSTLRATGVPAPSDASWYFDEQSGTFEPLTAEAYKDLTGQPPA